MKEVVTGKNTSGKGKDVVPDEEEIPSLCTSAARLMVVEESVVNLNDWMGNLQTIVEWLSR